MNFDDTPEEAAFRAEVRAFLAEAAAPYVKAPATPWEEEDLVALARAWQRTKAEAGYAAILWPREYGGREGTPMQSVIYAQEEARYHIPFGVFIKIGVNLAGPTIMAHGTHAQKQRFIPDILRADKLWCQLFSEPAAGSDLAGLRTRAVRDGDNWVISGQKVWTSWGHFADYGILIARTDADVPKHKGLTFFLIDMKAPGISIRPIRQINGKSEFNEVFLDGVRVPDSMRLGGVGEGWKVTMTTLMNERAGQGGDPDKLDAGDLLALASRVDGGRALHDPALRRQVADLHVRMAGVHHFRMRMLTALSKGQSPGPEAALGKLVFARALQEVGSAGMELAGAAGLVADRSQDKALPAFQEAFVWASALRVAGGADEVLRNQLAERVLGLPGDIRVDKDVAFKDIPVGR